MVEELEENELSIKPDTDVLDENDEESTPPMERQLYVSAIAETVVTYNLNPNHNYDLWPNHSRDYSHRFCHMETYGTTTNAGRSREPLSYMTHERK